MGENSNRHRIKQLEVMVAEVMQETPDTTTLVLFTGNDHLEYKPGHFLTIAPQQFIALDRWVRYLEDLKGRKEPPRAYSMSSAPHEKYLAITVKEERYISGVTKYPPLLSPILAMRSTPGTKMVITGFTGPYVMGDDDGPDHVLHVCAGSGVVPSYSIIKDDLRNGTGRRHTLVYSNKLLEDVIFFSQLEALQQEYPDRLLVLNTLTREQAPASFLGRPIRKGRISLELVKEAVGEDIDGTRAFVCGPDISKLDIERAREKGEKPPTGFLSTALGFLAEIGIPKNRIRKESYG